MNRLGISEVDGRWTPRELAALIVLADNREVAFSDRLVSEFRTTLLIYECEADELAPEWDWRRARPV